MALLECVEMYLEKVLFSVIEEVTAATEAHRLRDFAHARKDFAWPFAQSNEKGSPTLRLGLVA